MNYRKFKDNDIAEVGLGTWQLGSADWGNVDEAAAFAILQAYVDAGGNFIDTADVYGMGVSETVIGKFLKSTGKELYVATKLGRREDAPNGWPQNFTYDTMRRHVEASLKHLDVPHLFLEQLHCIPTDEMKAGKVFDNLRKMDWHRYRSSSTFFASTWPTKFLLKRRRKAWPSSSAYHWPAACLPVSLPNKQLSGRMTTAIIMPKARPSTPAKPFRASTLKKA